MSAQPRGIPAGRLRRRLALAFALVAAVTAAVLAGSSYALVREARLRDSVERTLEQTRLNLTLAPELLREGPDALLAAYERRGRFETVGRTNAQAFSSSVSLTAEQVPSDLAALVRRGDLAYRRTSLGGTRYLVAGGRVPGARTELYFFFSEAELWDDLAELRTILVLVSAALILLGGLTGMLLARRTLAPVARASAAARSLAEGLLETRLPVDREDEFGTWAASFNEMAEALGAKIAALSEARERERRFTADVAHELRTPLTALVGEAELLREHLDRMPADARRPTELLVADIDRLRRLVDDLLEISQLDAGAAAVRLESVDLLELVGALLPARGWDGRVRLEGGGAVARTDPRRVERVVANLVGNALEHGGRDVRVRVDTEAADAVVEVVDDGAGIPAPELERIFDRFYKRDRARAGGGTGLGLAIARENTLLLGGRLEVASDAADGTRFTLRLPVTEPLRHGGPAVSRARDDVAHDHTP